MQEEMDAKIKDLELRHKVALQERDHKMALREKELLIKELELNKAAIAAVQQKTSTSKVSDSDIDSTLTTHSVVERAGKDHLGSYSCKSTNWEQIFNGLVLMSVNIHCLLGLECT